MTDAELARAVARRFSPSGILDREDYEGIALFAIWKARGRYREGAAGFEDFAWRYAKWAIMQALRNASGISHLAYERGERAQVGHLPDGWDATDDDRAWRPEAAFMAKATAARIWAWVDELPPMQRTAVRAAINGEAHGARTSYALYHGRRKLRERLCEEYSAL